jgi:hypothetical protein
VLIRKHSGCFCIGLPYGLLAAVKPAYIRRTIHCISPNRRRRHDLRAAHEGIAATGCGAGPANNHVGRKHASQLSAQARPLAKCHYGARADQSMRKRYGAVRGSLFTFLEHPDVPPDNNDSERELRPTAT